MAPISALYHVTSRPGDVERLARAIAVEQTVEVPEGLIDARIEREIVGDVVSVEPLGADRFAVRIAYNPELVNGLPELINLVYGNVSIMEGVRLEALDLPDETLRRFRGPNFGVEGLRRLLGVRDRPLLATVLKPRGSHDERFREIAHEFARAGGDLVKDDNNLIDESVATFRRRVALCQDAVAEANARTGRNCLYLANLIVPLGRLERYVEAALGLGVRGVLVPPLILGLDVVRDLADRHGLIVMAHPSFSGTLFHDRRHGIEPGVMMGTLYRLAGVDITIFTNHGGRFTYAPAECASIASACRAPLGPLAPALPGPAGGMGLDRVGDMAREYGPDGVLIVGGALLGHPGGVAEATGRYLDAIRTVHPERLVAPEPGPARAVSLDAGHAGVVHHVAWKERGRADPAGVLRHEIVGEAGEGVALRYFELAPGAASPPERRVNTHAIIATRGRCALRIDGVRFDLGPYDVAYVPALSTYELRNEGAEPFGYFCIVDRDPA